VAAEAFESVSSWRQPIPAPASSARAQLIENVARQVVAVRPGRVRVVVDGFTASGKTSFAHELAAAVRRLGRSTLRATFDDFKKPWRDAREKGYDRVSGEGYYRNAPDFPSARALLLEPAGPDGSGVVALCGHDPLTGEDHRAVTVDAPKDAVLIVDSVFGMRPEYDAYWDMRIWLDVPVEVAFARGIERDTESEGRAEAERLHRDRYQASEQIYLSEVDPKAKAELIIDNTDYATPQVIRPATSSDG
jgi:uridine kinase